MVYEKKKSRDPFAVKPFPKAYYHPSKEKRLTSSQRKTAISPSRSGKNDEKEETETTPLDQMFLKKSNSYLTKTQDREEHEISGSSKFDESWPSSEHPSTVNLTEDVSMLSALGRHYSVDDVKDLSHTSKDKEAGRYTKPGETETGESSTLQRYVERFRKAEPRSREQRLKENGAKMKDFWWLSDRPHDQSYDQSHDQSHEDKSKLTRENLTSHSLMSSGVKKPIPPPSPLDAKTRYIQERAEKLLEKSESSILSSDQDPAVSTDGLGSTNSGTIISSIDEQPYRPQFTKAKEYTPHFHGPASRRITKSARPEDDILYQWRLKRKLETARSSPKITSLGKDVNYKQMDKGKTEVSEMESKLEEFKTRLTRLETSAAESPKRTASVQFTAVPKKSQGNEDPVPGSAKYPIASPTLGRKKDSDSVDPHLHLMCDVLPCPHQSSYIDTTQQTTQDIYSLSPIHRVTEDKKHDKRDLEKNNQKLHDLDLTNQNIDDSAISDKHDEQQRYKYLQAERPHIEEKKTFDIEEKTTGRSKSNKDHQENKNDKIVSDSDDDDSYDTDTYKKRTKVQRGQRSRYSERSKFKKGQDKDEEDSDDDAIIRKQDKNKRQQQDNGRIPKPRHSDSPKLDRRGLRTDAPVEDVIGQVVKTRLFDASASTVMSSVDSLPSFSVTHQSIQSQPEQPICNKTKTTRENTPDDTYDSDMEYPDDELLKILRKQRSQYEEKLRRIDHLLSLEER